MPHQRGPCWWLLPCTSALQHSLLGQRTSCQPPRCVPLTREYSTRHRVLTLPCTPVPHDTLQGSLA